MTILADEPPEWIQPVRHTLGAALLRAGRPDVAEEVYREDLVRYPGNGWALFGVARSFEETAGMLVKRGGAFGKPGRASIRNWIRPAFVRPESDFQPTCQVDPP